MLRSLTAAALIVCSSSAVAEVPVPVAKPVYAPWWVLETSPQQCASTRAAIEKIRKGGAELLYWAPLQPIGPTSFVAELWGTPGGAVETDGANQWMVIIHMSNGISCEIASGAFLPEWAANIDGVRS